MKILMQLAIICLICLIGELISAVLPIPFPSSVISMLLVFLLLLTGPLKVHHISKQTSFLLDNMGIFFIPSAVSIVNYVQYMEGKLPVLVFIFFISILTTFAITAWTVTLVVKLEQKWKGGKNHGSHHTAA